MYRRFLEVFMLILSLLTLFACGGGGGGAPATGGATVSLTDAPGDYDHVYVTVRDIWFHSSDAAGPDDGGWRRYPLAAPVTVDLLTLSNGVVGSPYGGYHSACRKLSADQAGTRRNRGCTDRIS